MSPACCPKCEPGSASDASRELNQREAPVFSAQVHIMSAKKSSILDIFYLWWIFLYIYVYIHIYVWWIYFASRQHRPDGAHQLLFSRAPGPATSLLASLTVFSCHGGPTANLLVFILIIIIITVTIFLFLKLLLITMIMVIIVDMINHPNSTLKNLT